MVDPRLEKLARLSVRYSVAVKPKEIVVIQGTYHAVPMLHQLYRECLLAGAYPAIFANMDHAYMLLKYGKEHQIKFVSPIDKFIFENMDVQIGLFCDPNPKAMMGIDSSRLRIRAEGRTELTDIFFKREAEGKFRWTGLPYPISAQAQEAGMALEEYENFVYSSCLVDRRDPIAEWKKVRKQQDKICSFLDKVSKIRVVGEDTDLRYSVKGRKWINCSGEKNMPDGEVFTGPIENTAEGTVRFTYPGLYQGKEVEDIRLTFKKGKVVKASAAKGEDLLKQILKIDGADRIGEAAIGTNYGINRFTKSMLFDEKMGGTIHMAIGRSIPESGGVNKSAIHWDILKDMRKDAEIYADNELFYKNGKFLNF